jgi:hypothetical protein
MNRIALKGIGCSTALPTATGPIPAKVSIRRAGPRCCWRDISARLNPAQTRPPM